MFKSGRVLAAIAAGAFVTMSTAASAAPAPANPAASLSVTRAASPAAHGSRIGASVPAATFINVGILAALVAVVLVATKNSDDNNSASR